MVGKIVRQVGLKSAHPIYMISSQRMTNVKQQKLRLTVEDRAVVLEWRLVPHFNQVVIIATFPDTTSNIRHVTPAPPVVRSLNCRVNAIWIPSSNHAHVFQGIQMYAYKLSAKRLLWEIVDEPWHANIRETSCLGNVYKLEGRRLSWFGWLTIHQCGSPVQRRSPIPVLTRPNMATYSNFVDVPNEKTATQSTAGKAIKEGRRACVARSSSTHPSLSGSNSSQDS